MSACNYNPDATQDDGSCTPAKDGFDCHDNALSPDMNGATFFIRTQQPSKLVQSLSHAEVDLPEDFEVGFEITPQETPFKDWSNIIHFTATGKVLCKVLQHVIECMTMYDPCKCVVDTGCRSFACCHEVHLTPNDMTLANALLTLFWKNVNTIP